MTESPFKPFCHFCHLLTKGIFRSEMYHVKQSKGVTEVRYQKSQLSQQVRKAMEKWEKALCGFIGKKAAKDA